MEDCFRKNYLDWAMSVINGHSHKDDAVHKRSVCTISNTVSDDACDATLGSPGAEGAEVAKSGDDDDDGGDPDPDGWRPHYLSRLKPAPSSAQLFAAPAIPAHPVPAHPSPANPKPERLLRLPELKTRCGLSRSTIYQYIKDGKFPAAISIGARAVAWLESEIDRWIAEQVQSSSASI